MQLCAWLVGAAIAGPAGALVITTENNPPFNYQDGQRIAGISTDILVEMGRRARVPLDIRMLPWARAYQSALSTPDTCVYSTVRLPEREAHFKWIGPLSTNKWALFGRSDFKRKIASIEQARPYRIGGVTQDAKSLYLQSLGFTNLDLVGDDSLNPGKLLAGRIDLWITGLYRGKHPDIHTRRVNIKPVLVVREVDYFLACHPKTSQAALNALAGALQELQRESYVKAVTERYADWLQ